MIEMAFGFSTNKWRLLNTPLQTSRVCPSSILLACARLHSYCIDMDHHPGVLPYDNSTVHSCLQRIARPQHSAQLGGRFSRRQNKIIFSLEQL